MADRLQNFKRIFLGKTLGTYYPKYYNMKDSLAVDRLSLKKCFINVTYLSVFVIGPPNLNRNSFGVRGYLNTCDYVLLINIFLSRWLTPQH